MKLTAFTLFTAVSLSLAMERVSIDGFGAFGDAEEEDEEEQLSDQEQEAAETLAGQLADQIKGQIKDQMRASKLGRSRIAQTDELTLATANNQYERVEKLLLHAFVTTHAALAVRSQAQSVPQVQAHPPAG